MIDQVNLVFLEEGGKDFLLKVVSTYDQPDTIIPGHSYHKLEMFKIEKLATET